MFILIVIGITFKRSVTEDHGDHLGCGSVVVEVFLLQHNTGIFEGRVRQAGHDHSSAVAVSEVQPL